ncbi:YrhK family protein [Mesobacillus harenae]|uniref:YrhK family protein n=1 Tax=Mesobacillus harenae TaxID=2213203 RepID=UPI00157FCD4B|nr:YrhK family protein [Mesobacillus harenae]
MQIKKEDHGHQEDVYISIGKYQMIIRQRYKVLSLLNDVLLGVLYLTGSILFLTNVSQTISILFFLGGSILMILRAILNIMRDLHLKRFKPKKQTSQRKALPKHQEK